MERNKEIAKKVEIYYHCGRCNKDLVMLIRYLQQAQIIQSKVNVLCYKLILWPLISKRHQAVWNTVNRLKYYVEPKLIPYWFESDMNARFVLKLALHPSKMIKEELNAIFANQPMFDSFSSAILQFFTPSPNDKKQFNHNVSSKFHYAQFATNSEIISYFAHTDSNEVALHYF